MTRPTVHVVQHDVPIIVGSGIGGLSTALSLGGSLVVTGAQLGDGSSSLAQGGIAAALAKDDKPGMHAADTVRVGGGIVFDDLADTITKAAPGEIDLLLDLGADFDRTPDGELHLGREAGHSSRRIVHAGGDATGAEIMRAMRSAVMRRDDIELLTRTMLIDLIRVNDRISGVFTRGPDGTLTAHLTTAVVLATGGIGGVYRRSTNPINVRGSGLAAAARQGAMLADLEFVQFHPTALTVADHPAPLVTEALRGEGATLIDETGDAFMVGVHPDADLAPRDVVSRSIFQHRAEGHTIFLDATIAIGERMPERFPTVFAACLESGIDPRRLPMEVAPAEHYHMGGIATDNRGSSSLPGLWAVGEVASTGFHGANRLASNSLLEAAVMGGRAATSIRDAKRNAPTGDLYIPDDAHRRGATEDEPFPDEIQDIAWDHIGIVRSRAGLTEALRRLGDLRHPSSDEAVVARLIAAAALRRTESRGAHYRSDHPHESPDYGHRSMHTPHVAGLVALSTSSAMVA